MKRIGAANSLTLIFQRWLTVSIVCGLILVSVFAGVILTNQARNSALQILSDHLTYLTEQIKVKNASTDNLKTQTAAALFEKAYAVQQLLRENPSLLQNEEQLGQLCTGLNLSMLDVSDSTGRVAATWPYKENYVGVLSFADFDVTEKYMALITCPNVKILEEPRQNVVIAQTEEHYLQFAGVARLDQPGIIQIGQPGRQYDDALEASSVGSIAPGYTIQNGGFVVITDNSRIVSASDKDLIGSRCADCAFLPAMQEGTLSHVRVGQTDFLAASTAYDSYGIYAFLPASAVSRPVVSSLLYMLACVLVVFLSVFLILSLVLDRMVVSGIQRINAYVGQVTHGDLGELADVRTSAELSMLTDGINSMVLALRRAFAKKEEALRSVMDENQRIVSEREEFRDKALHDPMTGLFNRSGFMEICALRLAESLLHGCTCALFMLDHDQFKAINDTYGHAAGDCVLIHTAAVLNRFFREDDIIARIGGDEFCVFLSSLNDPALAAVRAEALTAAFREPVSFEGRQIAATCSIGVALSPGDGSTLDALYKSADQALYNAKTAGRAVWRPAGTSQAAAANNEQRSSHDHP